jgi:Photosynthetic reaction centre cytochrome C subunit
MKSSRLTLAAAVTVVAASVSLLAGRSLVFAAQEQAPIPPPPQSQPGPPPPAQHEMPAPTNLKVLPKNLTGAQVHEIMEKWEGELGTSCKTCHAADPKNLGPNGKPRLNFADDSKEDKQTARKMFKMVEDINANYISKIDSSGMPVTCGTCHRGHLGPEPFAAPEHDHAH